ncbi:MAG TPA: DUF3810 domain-containing protein [Flavobacteriaceae bacterium]|jgi:hypothetical protein|nr:DUF3810 domain-containing protein [Flavobacteriaceae bacterium]
MKKTAWILSFLIPFQWLFLNRIKNHPDWIELYYSQKIYPLIFDSQRLFFQHVPISLGDIIYAVLLILVIWSLIQLIQKKLKLKTALLYVFASASVFSGLFYLNWGLNYHRIPLHEKLNYDLIYNEAELEITVEKLIAKSNLLHDRLNNSDTLAVTIPYSKTEILDLVEKEFDFNLFDFQVTPFAKNSLWSTPLSYMGYAGYLNPFTLEAQVNSKIPKLTYITTTAHEMAHQLGIASESEANFVAYYTISKHSDPFLQYSGAVFALRYCYSELYKANPEAAQKQLSKLNPGIIQNFRELSAFWKKFQNPLEPYLKKGYDSYLKANGQAMGIQSYNAMVAMLIAYSKKNP